MKDVSGATYPDNLTDTIGVSRTCPTNLTLDKYIAGSETRIRSPTPVRIGHENTMGMCLGCEVAYIPSG